MTVGELRKQLLVLPKDSPIYVYCGGFFELDEMKYDPVDEEAIVVAFQGATPPKK